MRSTQATSGIQEQKISPPFAFRMDSLGRQARVRAVVLLNGGDSRVSRGRNFFRLRRSRFSALSKNQEGALAAVDDILKRHGGERVSAQPNALGGIIVEATSAGILALAKSEHVKAIFEDQAISPLP